MMEEVEKEFCGVSLDQCKKNIKKNSNMRFTQETKPPKKKSFKKPKTDSILIWIRRAFVLLN